MAARRGFIVSSWYAKGRILATGRLESGESFALAARADPGAVLVPLAYADRAAELLRRFGARRDPEAWSELDGSPRARFVLPGAATSSVERALLEGGVPLPILDRSGVDTFLSERGIASGIAIEGECRSGERVDLVFVDPKLVPAESRPPLTWLALDIETDREGRVVAVSLVDRRFGTEAAAQGGASDAPEPDGPRSRRAPPAECPAPCVERPLLPG